MTVTHFFPVVAWPFMVWNKTAAVHNIDSAAEVVPERAVTPSPRVPRSLSTTAGSGASEAVAIEKGVIRVWSAAKPSLKTKKQKKGKTRG